MFEYFWKTCKHNKITPGTKAGYCPDCGEYVENHWYITRCKCCGVKQISIIRNGKIITLNKFCKNCGSNIYSIEEVQDLDIVNINYAVVLKETPNKNTANLIQTWIEKNQYSQVKLLPSF